MNDPAKIFEDLKKPLDPTMKQQRQVKGTSLSYLPTHYAIDQANRIFGFDGWSFTIDEGPVEVYMPRFVEEKTGEIVENVILGYKAYITVNIPGVRIITDVGFVEIPIGRDTGLPLTSASNIEASMKGCISDGVKRCLRWVGSQFGNDLYNHEDRRGNADAAPARQSEAASAPRAAATRRPSDNAELPVNEICPVCGSKKRPNYQVCYQCSKDGRKPGDAKDAASPREEEESFPGEEPENLDEVFGPKESSQPATTSAFTSAQQATAGKYLDGLARRTPADVTKSAFENSVKGMAIDMAVVQDILGVTTVAWNRRAGQNWYTALQAVCSAVTGVPA